MSAEVIQLPSNDLAKHEKVIAEGLRSFVEVGRALAAIQEGELYTQGYKSFRAYCRERWAWSHSQALKLIDAAEVVTIVTTKGLPAPANEAQCRPLAKLPPAQQAKAWEKAVKTAPNGTPTAKHVAEVVTEMAPPKPEPTPESQSDQIVKIIDRLEYALVCARQDWPCGAPLDELVSWFQRRTRELEGQQ